jgi:hypothetical protein
MFGFEQKLTLPKKRMASPWNLVVVWSNAKVLAAPAPFSWSVLFGQFESGQLVGLVTLEMYRTELQVPCFLKGNHMHMNYLMGSTVNIIVHYAVTKNLELLIQPPLVFKLQKCSRSNKINVKNECWWNELKVSLCPYTQCISQKTISRNTK